MEELAHVLRSQDGVVSRRQALDVLGPTGVARLRRRRELVDVHPGVYVEHTGPLTWQQRAWAAVLHAGPGAALCLTSALRATEGPNRREPEEPTVHVAIARERRISSLPGVRVHRYAGLRERVQWEAGPPRVRYDESLLDVAAAARDDLAAVAVLADACGAGRTTAGRLRERLDARARVARRGWLASVLDDAAAGTCSVLEHGFLTRVVLPHGLPTGELQAVRRTSAGSVVRDVEHRALGLAVELDGRAFHSQARDRDRDLRRDLVAAAEADLRTVRLGYRLVFAEPCRTAEYLALLMARCGWTGELRRCPQCGRTRQPG